MIDVTKLTGVDGAMAKKAAEDVIRFESKLAIVSEPHQYCLQSLVSW